MKAYMDAFFYLNLRPNAFETPFIKVSTSCCLLPERCSIKFSAVFQDLRDENSMYKAFRNLSFRNGGASQRVDAKRLHENDI